MNQTSNSQTSDNQTSNGDDRHVYLMSEVSKLMNDPELQAQAPLNLGLATAWVILHLKGTNVKIFDMRSISPLATYFVLADVQNPIQAEAIRDQIVWSVKRSSSSRIRGVEGGRESNWTLIDLDEVVVHLFIEKSRELYNLEALWPHAPRVDIPESFYFQKSFDSFESLENKSEDEILGADENKYL